jgi:DNA end-binding protein Ku
MKTAGSVLLHHEEPRTGRIGADGPERLRRSSGVPLSAVDIEPIGHVNRSGSGAGVPLLRYRRPMPARPTASGSISFGLVSIPVKLFPATQPSSSLSFNMLHAKDSSRLKQQYVCAKDGQVVPREETVKGYEFAKDRYVTFTAEELKALDEIASQAIDIAEFVPAADVDAVFFDKAYYLGPDKGGARAYKLLGEAMRRAGKAALGRYAAHGKQYLVLIRPLGPRLVMQQLFYADEIRPAEEIPVDDAEVKEPEIQLALQLIDQTSSADGFHPERYKDVVKQRVEEAIERKVAGQEIQVVAAEPQAQVIDLMEALKRSVGARQPAGGTASPLRQVSASEAGKKGERDDERKPPRHATREAVAHKGSRR